MRNIAIRLFINKKFAGSFGNQVFNRAVYNGSIELHDPLQKYLVDFYEYLHWENRASSESQFQLVKELGQTDLPQAPQLLMSWVSHYDSSTKIKTPVQGFCAYLQESHEIYLRIDDPVRSTKACWDLPVRHCKNVGDKLPVLLATNYDLVLA